MLYFKKSINKLAQNLYILKIYELPLYKILV